MNNFDYIKKQVEQLRKEIGNDIVLNLQINPYGYKLLGVRNVKRRKIKK